MGIEVFPQISLVLLFLSKLFKQTVLNLIKFFENHALSLHQTGQNGQV